MKKVSIIIPAYNEEDVLDELYNRLCQTIDQIKTCTFEVVLVDDSSTDKTPELIAGLIDKDPRFKTIRFPRNFGSHIAIRAGIDKCTGDYAVIMAADLQDPPELIADLVQKMDEGYNVVWAYRESRDDPFFKVMTSNIYNWLNRKIGEQSNMPKGADVVAIDKNIMNHLRTELREKDSNLFGIIRWAGYKQVGIGYAKQARFAGESKFGLGKRIKIAVDSFVSFSFFPIRMISYTGIGVAVLGFLYALFIVAYRLIHGSSISGFATIVTAVLVLSGIQMVMLGVVAEYLWRTFNSSRERPLYIVEKTRGFDESVDEKQE